MKFCPHCSKELSAQTTFCPDCGKSLNGNPTLSDASPHNSTVSQRFIGGLISLVLGVIGIVYSIIAAVSNEYVKLGNAFGVSGGFEAWLETPHGITTIIIFVISIICIITGIVLIVKKQDVTHSNQRRASFLSHVILLEFLYFSRLL